MRDRPPVERFILFKICWLCVFLLAAQPHIFAQSAPSDSSLLALRHPVADLAQTNLLTSLSDSVWIYHADTRNIPAAQLALLPYRKATRHSDHFVAPAAINKET